MGDFGDRMKRYERQEAGRRFENFLPVCARIDGKCFSKFTKGLTFPYDKRLSDLMCQTTSYLVETTQANIGYTQSDEISLVWYRDECNSQIYFNGRIQKMTSVLASLTTAFFNSKITDYLPEKIGKLALFDCRVWQLPSLEEAANMFLWRELDATKNSISMSARCYFSHKALHKKTGKEMKEMLRSKDIIWDKYPTFFKYGTFIQQHKIARQFTQDELKNLPEKHKARKNPDLTIERTDIRPLKMPPFSKVCNRVDVIFYGAIPKILNT